jgi:hypothetical protein
MVGLASSAYLLPSFWVCNLTSKPPLVHNFFAPSLAPVLMIFFASLLFSRCVCITPKAAVLLQIASYRRGTQLPYEAYDNNFE